MQTDNTMAVNNAMLMEAVLLAGRIILENGGETYRAEDTVERMGRAFGCQRVDVFAVPSGLFITLAFQGGEEKTSVQRIRRRNIHLKKVDDANQVSRGVASGDISPLEALEKLKCIAAWEDTKGRSIMPWAAALSSASFAIMFGGGLTDGAVAFVCGAVTQGLIRLIKRYSLHYIVASLVGGAICALIPLIFNRLTGLGAVDAMVAGALMPLLPGLAMTNAVQDTMRGGMLSGLTHGAQALLVGALVAGGALAAQSLFLLMEGGI
jgi:uncharacterized membrane protein YjjP (DUF1212 family)